MPDEERVNPCEGGLEQVPLGEQELVETSRGLSDDEYIRSFHEHGNAD